MPDSSCIQTGLNVINALGSAATAIGLLFLWYQSRLLWRQVNDEHKRSEIEHSRFMKEKAVELLGRWAKDLTDKMSSAKKLAESLSEEQAMALYSRKAFEIDELHASYLCGCLPGIEDESDLSKLCVNGKIVLAARNLFSIRSSLVDYLNILESVLVAWHFEIADREIIENELRNLVTPSEQNGQFLGNFRVACGGNKAFPAIEEFIKHIDPRTR